MPRVKIQLADNIKRVVTFDSDATKGATLGTNVFLPSGAVGTPTTVLQWLGGALPSQPSGGGNSGIPVGNYLTTKGDLLTRDTQVQRLGIGTQGQALVVDAGLPSWGFVGVPGGGTGLASYHAGDMLFADAPDSLAPLSVGPDGWVLSAYGGFPEWQMPIWVESVIAGTGIAINDADPQNPVVSLDASVGDLNDVDLSGLADGDVLVWDNSTSQWVATSGGGGGIETIVAGTGIAVDNTDPANPEVSLDAMLGELNDVDLSGLADGDVIVWDSSSSQWVASAGGGGSASSAPEVRGASFSGGIGAIAVPTNNVPISIREDCTITGLVVLTQGGTGSCVLDIWKHPYSTYPPTSADSICASSKPTISSGVKYQDTTFTGWNVTLSAGDTLLVNLASCSTFTAVSMFLILTPVGSTPADGYTDQRAEDAVGGILTDTATVNFTYNGVAHTIIADVITAGLDVFDSTHRGVVPASGGGTANFLRADGTFAAPPGTGIVETSGTFTATMTYGTAGSTVTGTAQWLKQGNQVTLFLPSLLLTPGANAATGLLITGAPAGIRPTRVQVLPANIIVSANSTPGLVKIDTNADIKLGYYLGVLSGSLTEGFTAGVSNGLDGGFGGNPGQTFTYTLI